MTCEIGRIKEDGMYSPAMAAELLGMHRTTLWRRTKKGQIKSHFRVDGQRLYQGKDLISFFNSVLEEGKLCPLDGGTMNEGKRNRLPSCGRTNTEAKRCGI